MALTKKEMRKYKPLIVKKIEDLGMKSELQYTKTGFKKTVDIPRPSGFGTEKRTFDTYRATNLQRNLLKKLLKLSVGEVERFLSQDFSEKEPSK